MNSVKDSPGSGVGDQICFLHIGKNGGTTLLDILDRMEGVGSICKLRHMEELLDLSQSEIQSYRLFRGHFWYDVYKIIGRKPKYFTVLREPQDRARSVYEHIHRHPHGRHEVVKKLSFEEYVFSGADTSLDIRNWQTRVITSQIDPSEEPDLELAKERVLKEFSFVGIMERYLKSLLLMAYTFSWPPVTNYVPLNVTEGSMRGRQFDKRIMDRLRDLNRKDMELYRFCVELFDQKFELMCHDALFQERLRRQGLELSEVIDLTSEGNL